jgi:solute carrier family 50 (sugar transporter)
MINVQLPNVLGFVLGLLQMLLYAIYRNGGEKTMKKEKKAPIEPLKSIVIETQSEKIEQEKKNKGDDNEEKVQSEEPIGSGV